MAKKFCTECGEKLNDSAQFCSKCGCPIDNVKNTDNEPTNVNNILALFLMVDDGYGMGYRYSKSKIIAIIVFVAMFLLLYNVFLSHVGMEWLGHVLLICLLFYVACIGIGFVCRKMIEF